MKINNPLQMNDWGIKKFLKVVLAIQLAMWGVISLDVSGLEIPILRQLIGFVYLTFIPGIIILRILKLHKLGNIETLLYTVGLSIAILMFTGLFMNSIYPLFGIIKPISLTPLIITISAIVLVLCVLCYVLDRNFSDPSFIDIKNVLSPPALFLCLIPFLSIFGSYLMNFYQNNILLLFLIIIIAIIVILIGFDKFIPKNLYPLAVFVIAISLLFHRSLISMYIWGWDIHIEYYFSNLVISSAWNPAIPNSVNAMLSIAMLAPIYSIVSNIEITWVFKIIYPLLFSLVPVGLYRVFQKQTDDRIAFLSCFFFMSLLTFYGEMLALARQEIAELFLVLLILLMVNKDMNKIKRSFLFIVFGISLAVSHYGLSYIYMFGLITAWLLLVSSENLKMQRLTRNFHSKFSRKNEKLAGNPISLKIEDRTISSTFVLLFITFTLTWYMYVSSSSTFDTIVEIGNHVASSISTDFLNPEAAQGLSVMLAETPSPLHHIHKIINYLNQMFIILGAIVLLSKHSEMKFEREYVAFSMVSLVLCIAGVSIPFFASSLNMSRLYQITLIFLAPFCVIGGITVFRMINRIVRVTWTNKTVRSSLKVLSVYFVIFLLYQTGFVYGVAEGNFYSISLSSTYDYPRFNEQEVLGAEWVCNVKDRGFIYTDAYRWLLFFCFKWRQAGSFSVDADSRVTVPAGSYIYLGTWNVVEHNVTVISRSGVTNIVEYIDSEDIGNDRNKIYANGGAQVYYR
ncbi:MAG: DUF2206 domain-containing protein [Methanophagales archaeon]|nr:DUF2206 domain-containing protein [Methanophagales archaeon]